MKNLIESTNYYNDIIHSDRHLTEVFKELSIIGTEEELQLLFERFHEELRKEFKMVRYNITETTHQEKYDMPAKLFKRLGVATMMLVAMGHGRIYDEELYSDTVKYIENVKKDQPLN